MLVPFADEDEEITASTSIKGIRVKCSWLTPAKLPPVRTAMTELGLG